MDKQKRNQKIKRNQKLKNHPFLLSLLTGVFLFSIFLSIFSPMVNASPSEASDVSITAEQAFSLTAQKLDNQNIELKFAIAPGFLLYKDHFKFRTLEGRAIENKDMFPKAKIKHDEALGDLQIYTQHLTLQVALPKNTPGKTGIRIEYQGCGDNGFCYAPVTKEIVFSADGKPQIVEISPEEFELAAAVSTKSTKSENSEKLDINTSATESEATASSGIMESNSDFLVNQLKNGAFPLTLLLFLGSGILLSFTPCVLPMLPILANILVGQDKPFSRRRATLLASVYVLSVSICYAVAGVFAGLAGSFLQASLQAPIFLVSLSFLLMLFALNQFNLVQFQMPQVFANTLNNLQSKQKQGSVLGAMVMGAISALVVSPCVTPALVGALSYIGQTGNAVFGGLALFALALGMGLPLLIIACVGSHYLPKAGAWMGYIKVLTGAFLLVLAVIFLMRGLPNQNATANVSASSNAQVSHFMTIQSKNDLQAALKAAEASGKSVILDVYADWCVSCQQIDKEVFENNTVLSTLKDKDVQLLRLDLTKQTKSISELQKELQIIGPPALLFFNANGEENKNYRLIGKIESVDFIKHVKHFFTTQKKK